MANFNINEIKEQFKTAIRVSQGIENPQVDELFELWLNAKRDFIEVMGGNLIYQYPEKVSFTLEESQKKMKLEDFICKLYDHYEVEDLADFVYTMKKSFFSNVVSEDYETPSGEIITKGTKLIKAFKYFIKDKEFLAELQDLASQIIQLDKVEGYMCLSVHPLDYLSVSENTHNWRSCHALDGEHRTGNLNYMVDYSTVVCYIKSEKEEILPAFSFPWNSKKWRTLLFFSNDWHMIFAGRSYPYGCVRALDFIISDLLHSAGFYSNSNYSCHYCEWCDDKITKFNINGNILDINPHVYAGQGKLIDLNDLIKNGSMTYHFNDILDSSYYDPVYSYLTFGSVSMINENTRFVIGASVPCLICGKSAINHSDVMVCDDCIGDYLYNYDLRERKS